MKKRIVLLIIIAFVGLNLFSQNNAKATWSPTYKMPSKLSTYIVGEDETGFYVLRSQRRASKGIVLEKFDKKMNLVFSEQQEMPKKDKKPLLFEDIILLNKQLVLLASFDDMKSKKSFAFAYPIDSKGRIGNKFKVLDERSNEGKRTTSFDFQLSKDTTKLLVYYNPPFDKYNEEEFKYKVFDNNLNLLWEKEIKLPYKDKLFSIEDYIVDNDANVYMLAKILPDRTKGEKEKKTEQVKKFIILSYKHKSKEFKQYEIKLKDKWVESINYDLNQNLNELIIGGFYSNNNKMDINGLFYMSIDLKSGEVKQTSKKEFDKDFMAEMVGEKKADKGKGLSEFYFDYFFSKKDGGAYIVAEQYYITVITTTDSKGNTSTRYVYHYNDIIVASISPKGEIDWIKKIPKKSADGSGYYLSYAINHNEEKDNLNIVFNDNPKNIELYKKNPNKLTNVGNLKKSVAMWVSLNSEGNMKRVPLFTAKELDKIILQPKTHMRSENDITVYGIRGKEYKFGKITFK